MGRKSEGPRYYASRRGWFATVNKETKRLLEGENTKANEKIAWERYNKFKAGAEAIIDGDRATVAVILNAYLHNAETRVMPEPLAPSTYEMHRSALSEFCQFERIGSLPMKDLKSTHIQRWIADCKQKKGWSHNYAHLRLRILRTAFKWAATEGELISSSPFCRKGKTMRLPSADLSIKRLAITEAEHSILLEKAKRRKRGNFAELLMLLYATGARPSELYKACADEWQPDTQAIVIDPADKRAVGRLKNRRHLLRLGRKRVIRIPDNLVSVMEKLVKDRPEGRIFFTENGKPWSDDTKVIASRIRGLVRHLRKQGKEVRRGLTLYSYRHSFITRWLTAGHNPILLCELLNTSMDMLQTHYSHLLEAKDQLKEAVNNFCGR